MELDQRSDDPQRTERLRGIWWRSRCFSERPVAKEEFRLQDIEIVTETSVINVNILPLPSASPKRTYCNWSPMSFVTYTMWLYNLNVLFAIEIHSKFTLSCSLAQLASFKSPDAYVERSIFSVPSTVWNSFPKKHTSLHSCIIVVATDFCVQGGHVRCSRYWHHPIYHCIHTHYPTLKSILDL